jgi:hypothetical protein
MRGALRAWLRQDDFAEHLMRYETPLRVRSLHGQHVSADRGDYITSATPPWSSGSLQPHNTYEHDVVPAH